VQDHTTLTRGISINAEPQDVFNFVYDPATWPGWPIQWLHASQNDAWHWHKLLHRSYGRSLMTKSMKAGVLRQEFEDIFGRTWIVQATLLPQQSGTYLILKITKPGSIVEDIAKRAIKMIDMKLVLTKVRIESVKEVVHYADN